MTFSRFTIARLPQIEFGCGAADRLPVLAAQYGRQMLLVTGASSLDNGEVWPRLRSGFAGQGLQWERVPVAGEPSPQLVDDAVRDLDGDRFDVVVGIGGGSVLDAGKAIAGLLKVGRPVMDYLEGVGPELDYRGPAVPFIAAPTTAGTGSEATKNAVLSVPGRDGFKKSFRHPLLVPEYAVVDPDLLASCPPGLVAANGMDALTQLIESYVSTHANRLTDALCESALCAVRHGLLPWFEHSDAGARERMAYAALTSGICLAQTGLGSVHGLASPLGAFYPIPHGVVCGTLLAAATGINIAAMSEREPDNPALTKYWRISELLCGNRHSSPRVAHLALVELLEDWTGRLGLPRLSNFRVTDAGLDQLVAHSRGSSMRTNPIVLNDAEIGDILRACL